MIYEKPLLELRPQIIFMSTKKVNLSLFHDLFHLKRIMVEYVIEFDKNLKLLNAKSEFRIFWT